jgi:F-type H+-transporting ATPase subunit a
VNPLESRIAFHIGPVPVTEPVVTTWAIMVVMVVGAAYLARRLTLVPPATQATLEGLVAAVDAQVREILRGEPAPYRGFVGTLFTFILLANWSSIIPGVDPPTAHVETDAALALLVFIAVIVYGIRVGGLRGYFRHFASPSVFMIPLNFVETISRSFSMLVRLFGNVMSGVVLIGVVASLARLFVPIPLMALDLLTGAIQAYIFAILAAVFISDAVSPETTKTTPKTEG